MKEELELLTAIIVVCEIMCVKLTYLENRGKKLFLINMQINIK